MRQTLLTILLVALIMATIWAWFAFVRPPSSPIGESPLGGVAAESPEEARLGQYRELKNLKPDTSVLTDPVFQSLSRYRAPNQPPSSSPGRANPFAPF